MCTFLRCIYKSGTDRNRGAYIWLGGLLLLLGGIGEWILGMYFARVATARSFSPDSFPGNTFPATVFTIFGGFWFTFGSTIIPGFGAYSSYTTGNVAATAGLDEGQFYATFSFLLIAMGILCAIFAVAAIRTNVVLFAIMVVLVPCCKL